MNKYRMRFTKNGTGRFISHLDLLRIFSRCARRCRIPLAYSTGFNPHPQVVFSAPIPLGVTSDAEYVDMTLEESMDPEELMTKLQNNLPEGIVPIWVRELKEGEPNIMKNVVGCVYELTVSCKNSNDLADLFYESYSKLTSDEPINVMKKSKSGVKETDIRPMIYSFERISSSDNCDIYKAVLSAGNEKNLRPETVIAAFSENAVLETVHKMNYTDINGNIIE